MFDKLLRELKKLETGVRVPLQLALDEEGYMDRRCPADVCQAGFKVLYEDWRDKVRGRSSPQLLYLTPHRAQGPAGRPPARRSAARPEPGRAGAAGPRS